MNNFIRIPSISSSILDKDELVSMTETYFIENKHFLELASTLSEKIEALNDRTELSAIEAMVDEFDSNECIAFFDEQNLARYVIELIANTKVALSEVFNILIVKFPIFSAIDSDKIVMEERIDRHCQMASNEMYPLYCKPSKEIIRHFIDICPSVAFYEIDNNYFACLTSVGSIRSCEIAYAFLKVDDSIPHNILNEHSTLSTNNPVIRKELISFLENIE